MTFPGAWAWMIPEQGVEELRLRTTGHRPRPSLTASLIYTRLASCRQSEAVSFRARGISLCPSRRRGGPVEQRPRHAWCDEPSCEDVLPFRRGQPTAHPLCRRPCALGSNGARFLNLTFAIRRGHCKEVFVFQWTSAFFRTAIYYLIDSKGHSRFVLRILIILSHRSRKQREPLPPP